MKIITKYFRKIFGHKIYILLVLIIPALLLQGCSNIFEVFTDIQNEINNTSAEVAETEKISDKGAASGGTLNFYLEDINTTNPVFAKDVYLLDLYSLMFESLFTLDEKADAVPLLAKSFEVSDNGLEWTISIRTDAYWHDGMKITANDVNFTLEELLNSSEENIYKEKLSVIDKFSAAGQDVLKITLNEPFSFLPELLTFPVIPMHIYGNEETNGAAATVPVGSGPYKCIGIDIGNGMLLKRNTEWWRAKISVDPIKVPNIENISAKIYKIEPLEALAEGLVDIAYIDKYYLSEYAENKDTVLYTYTGRYFEFIAFNTKNKVLADKAVREAIASTIDRSGIVEKLTGNKSTVWEVPFLRSTWLMSESRGVFYEGKSGAQELLENAGWEFKKELWTKRISGKNEVIKLELLVNNENKLRLDMAREIKEDLGIEGINISIRALSLEDLMKSVNSGNYDMALLGCSIPETSVAAGLYINDLNISKNPLALRNISRINNDEMREIFRNLYMAADAAERINIAASVLEKMYNDVAYTGICLNSQAVVYSRRIRNIRAPYLWNRLNAFNEWYAVE